ncbi:MAG: preprotein translocase subunit SecA, partial [Clostridia bacterium]|nr:preprotein translocase subunit SecA [Clostridia bacterium]
MGLIKWILTHDTRVSLKNIGKTADKIMELSPKYEAMTEEELKNQTNVLKTRLANGESLDDILVDAFATVREASYRVLNMRHYRVQLMGGICVHEGRVAELKTGEGKTLMATLPAYLNALSGKGVHIVTVNDYLASRDAEWMGKVYRYLGLTVGVNLHELTDDQKREAYACDITYGTNNEFGFDYLRDNLKVNLSEMVQRGLNFASIDEVESILI